MDESLFYCDVKKEIENLDILKKFREYSCKKNIPIYILTLPLGEKKFKYDFDDYFIILSPKHKICFVNINNDDNFCDFVEDFVEDLGYLSDKYGYKETIGRPKKWKNNFIVLKNLCELESNSVDDYFNNMYLENKNHQRSVDFLISLLIGSINDIEKIGGEFPNTILDEVKKKIILFDGQQSRFIYSKGLLKKRIVIQGLAGTGKTELLLHKLREIYTNEKESKIVFTCYNKILAENMRKRVPDFFNFMKVEEQIKWNERLWVMRSWGSRWEPNSGVYSFVCNKYGISFYPYSNFATFENVCKIALEDLNKIENFEPCFDYMLIDESQDFNPIFFDLCEKITKKVLYIAGDIFQDIYDRDLSSSVEVDYLLNKCYRTDPRTLMFAHAIGMGLYETPVIRWLDDLEWEACGYKINKLEDKYELSRVPLRRFEDMQIEKIDSIKLYTFDDEVTDSVIKIIREIRENNETVEPGDIAIVFLEDINDNYKFADLLKQKIYDEFGWRSSKGYELKIKKDNEIFISNKNNIKGLEFPFVISLVSGKISRNIFSRNTIYMMLTRSFITSYFLVNSQNTNFLEIYDNVAKSINNTFKMLLRKPTEEEINQQNNKLTLEIETHTMSVKEIVESVLKDYGKELTSEEKDSIHDTMTKLIQTKGLDSEEKIRNRTQRLIEVYLVNENVQV